jgi:hypothetical protein
MFGSICRSCDALPDGVLMLVTLIYRQIHKTFASSINDGGLGMLNATKLILSKLVMDHLYVTLVDVRCTLVFARRAEFQPKNPSTGKIAGIRVLTTVFIFVCMCVVSPNFFCSTMYAPIITDPKKHGIVGEKVLNELKLKKAQSGSKKKKDLEEQDGHTTPPFVSINLEILSDTLRHLASTLKYNPNAKWLNSLDEHVSSNQSESISWAASMIRLGSGMDLSVRRPVGIGCLLFCCLIDLLIFVALLFLSLPCVWSVCMFACLPVCRNA